MRRVFLRLPVAVQLAVLSLRRRVAAHGDMRAAPVSRGRALVIDDQWPRPDRDAGSIEIVNLVQAPQALGFDVTLAAGQEHAGGAGARQALEAAGASCLSPAHAPSPAAFLAREGHTLAPCALCRVYCGGRFLEQVLKHAREVAPPDTPFAARRGIGFIGSFAHAPNLEAMRWFLAEVWPLVLRAEPEMEMTVVGEGCPPTLLEGAPGRVRALGHVPDVGPWFEGLRLTVAPLRFGAGAKGKVASSLAAGVPCVATPIAA